jgi:hypothetical protein
MALGVFTIATIDQGGANYSLTLTGRALPYRPMSWEGTQQLEVVWYPGFPNATAQPLGPHESTSTFKGFWKDRFLGIIVAQQAPVKWGANNVGLTVDAIDYADSLRRIGAQLKVTWEPGDASGLGSVQRIGYLTRFSQTWHTPHDCEWEMEFTWTGRDDAIIVSETPTPVNYQTAANELATRTNALARATTAATNWLNTQSSSLSGFNQFKGDGIEGALSQVADATQALVSLSANVAQTIQLPASTLSQAGGIFGGLGRSYTQIARSLESSTSDSIAGIKALGALPAQLSGQTEQTREFAAALQFHETASGYRNLAQTSQEWVDQTAALQTPQPDFIYVASEGDDLRRVASAYYGDPSAWVFLAEYNGLVSSLLVAGQQVKIPPAASPRAA